MKMLLGALGYDAANEGYTGANWSINVAKQAISIGLNDGLKGEFNGVKAVNREEACLYAFNTLNATMVEYTNQTIVIANGTVKTDKVAKDMENNARTETIKEDNKMQFAEKYFTNLEKEPTSDDFGRPANKWTYKNTDIGTYVDYTLMVAEYTDGVSGKDVYNKIGKTAMDKYDLTATIDGNDAAKTILADVNKNNKDDMAGTDTGVLTQVFVDDDNKAAAIVEINTYLGIADSDYSEKKDEAKFTVWGLSKEGKTYTKVAFNKDGTLKTTSDSASFTVSGEDFNVSKVEEDDAYLFTVAAGEVQTFVPAEAVKDVLVAVADAAGILQDIGAVLALICDVVDGEDGLDPVELIQMAVVQVQVNGNQCGLPVVAVDDIGGEVDVEQGLQHSAGEEGKALAVIVEAVQAAALEVILVVQEVVGHAVDLSLEQAAVLAAPAHGHRVVGDILQLVAHFQVAVQRHDDAGIHAVLDQSLGQGACHVGQTAGLGKGGRFRSGIQDLHSISPFQKKGRIRKERAGAQRPPPLFERGYRGGEPPL